MAEQLLARLGHEQRSNVFVSRTFRVKKLVFVQVGVGVLSHAHFGFKSACLSGWLPNCCVCAVSTDQCFPACSFIVERYRQDTKVVM